jgi:hypothetical protein
VFVDQVHIEVVYHALLRVLRLESMKSLWLQRATLCMETPAFLLNTKWILFLGMERDIKLLSLIDVIKSEQNFVLQVLERELVWVLRKLFELVIMHNLYLNSAGVHERGAITVIAPPVNGQRH